MYKNKDLSLKEKILLKKLFSRLPTSHLWKKIGIKPHHGFCIPLSSIRSKKSCGIGEFTDLLPLIEWCNKLNMDVIQLLPLNETYYKNISFYKALSSCALDPIYLALTDLPYVCESNKLKDEIVELQKLNSTDRIEYDKIRKKKFKWLQKYYELFFPSFKKRKTYQLFIKNNPWLKPYSVFRFLKEKFKHKSWELWPEKYRHPTKRWVNSFYQNHLIEIEFYTFLQYLCFSQLSMIKKISSQKRVFLFGDLPIFVSKDSVDVWFYRKVFNLEKQAGSPPDKFSSKGQRWKLPLVDWDYLEKNNYFWWKQRLSLFAHFFHMYRIDHVVGFFRLWTLDFDDKKGKGKFIPEEREKWKIIGEKRLRKLIQFSSILPLGEDLGLIPENIYGTLKKLGICGLKILRWHMATPFCDYEPMSLTSLSSHDTETFEEWWHSCPAEARILCFTNNWKYNKKLTPSLRLKILKSLHSSSSIFHVNLLQEYLALDKNLVYSDPILERINIPGTVNKMNWTYKYKPSIEELISNKKLTKNIRSILARKK